MADPITPDPSLEPVVEPIVPDPNPDPAPAAEAIVEPPVEEVPADVLRASLNRANEQAGAERIKRQEALAELEELRTKLGQMKSVEEVDAVIADYQQRLVKAEDATNRLLAAQAAGLPAGFEDRIKPGTYEEMLADAQSLAPLFTTQKTPPVPLPPVGGRDPKPAPEDAPGSGYRAAKTKHAN